MSAARFPWLNGSTCLVTGGAGFIGSHVVEGLIRAGANITVIDDFSSGQRRNIKGLDLRLIEASVTDRAAVKNALAGCQYVFHLAAIPAVPRSIAEPIETAWANVWGTQVVLEEARLARIRRLVFSASSAAYGDTDGDGARSEDLVPTPISPYAAHKVASENLARAYGRSMGLETVSLRYFNIFGPRQNPDSPYSAVIPLFMRAALRGDALTIHGDGGQSRDFIHVENAVAANLLATRPDLTLSGDILNVGSGQAYSLLDLVGAIEKLIDHPVKRRHTEPRAGDVRFSRADISRIRARLGYEPVVSFEDGLRKTFEALRANLAL